MDASVARAPTAAVETAPPKERIELALEGMTCAACATRIEKVLNRVPGTEATVNFASESARVSLDPRQANAAQLIAAVEHAGYHARIRRDASVEKNLSEAQQTMERRRLTREFWISLALTLPLVLPMIPMFVIGDFSASAHRDIVPRWLQLALATPVQFWIGRRFYVGAWHSLRGGGANMDVLIALGTTMAWLLSASVTLLGLAQEHVYFEASAAVITLVLLGKLLEARAKAGTSTALQSLLKLQPRTAFIEREGAIVEVPLASVHAGDRIVVRAGDAVPVDAVVTDGASTIDESMLTGESRPVAKGPGETLYAGTVNNEGALRGIATGVGDATLLAGIVRLVRDAQGSKAPVQRLADRVAGIFVPIVLVIAAVTFAATWWFIGDAARALVHAIAVLVIACPCALGLATPTAIIVGTGRGAQRGVVIRNAAALEHAGRLSTLVVDKTGTLTEGKPSVVDVVAEAGYSVDDVIALSAALEQSSSHPLATAILRHAQDAQIRIPATTEYESVPGKGGARACGHVDRDGRIASVPRRERCWRRRLARRTPTQSRAYHRGRRARREFDRHDRARGPAARHDTFRDRAAARAWHRRRDDHRRQRCDGGGRCEGRRHRDVSRRRLARRQGRRGAGSQGGGTRDRDGRRRGQRRAGARGGGCEFRDRRRLGGSHRGCGHYGGAQ
jgi:Cu+-exporting ATPase